MDKLSDAYDPRIDQLLDELLEYSRIMPHNFESHTIQNAIDTYSKLSWYMNDLIQEAKDGIVYQSGLLLDRIIMHYKQYIMKVDITHEHRYIGM